MLREGAALPRLSESGHAGRAQRPLLTAAPPRKSGSVGAGARRRQDCSCFVNAEAPEYRSAVLGVLSSRTLGRGGRTAPAKQHTRGGLSVATIASSLPTSGAFRESSSRKLGPVPRQTPAEVTRNVNYASFSKHRNVVMTAAAMRSAPTARPAVKRWLLRAGSRENHRQALDELKALASELERSQPSAAQS